MGYEEKLVAPALKFRKFLDKTPNLHNIYVIAAISCTSGMMFGFDISSMSVFVDQAPYLRYFDSPSSVIQGFITASMSLGSFFGSLTSTFVSEPFGRRASLFICGILWCIGAAIQCSAQNRAQLICGRIIAGWGIGFGSSVAPVYGSEMAPRKIRGTIGGIFQFSVTVGIFIMFLIGYGCSHIQGLASFRIPWGVQMIPGIILLTGLFFIPESPRWLAKQGYWEDAEIIVANIQAKGNREDANVQIEMSEIKEQLLLDEHAKAFTYADLFSKKYRKRTFTAVSAQIWQQLTGMNVMMYYIVYIFQMAGYDGDTNLVPSLIQYILNMAVTVPALFTLDLLGRRTILLIGAALMMAFQFGVAGILATYSEPAFLSDTVRITIPEEHKSAAKGVIACCYLFVCSFAFSWGVGIWVYCSEVWGDSQSRQRGAALSTSANWIFNFAIAMFTPSSFRNITWKTYCIYATFCACMFIHVFFFFPETKGKRLEEIGQLWEENVPAWRSASWEPSVPIATDAELIQKMDTSHEEHPELMHSHLPSSEEKVGTV
ncbi:general substrate transporter [Metschnikowia bicuspidata var. bicuspidata NRRL YB-4993]|uniref:General substrate transporter n=1 Tax=Metschnikowia bicuspidata var. bicuspidata NRRL YB-4993 TaxID=869754 RepID=A0A1A0HG07_9ASCO|nr:general substrate transporter [Metschnikowia bicuspidata var. bicuspidata NRRL YB-4993]OBA23094.1 general substrate transporter [Metschnikowia bicuspidata var. bicuspidata NRRL YB-4993]